MVKTRYLPIAARRRPGRDALIVIEMPLPLMRSDESESIACGSCKRVIWEGVSHRKLYEMHAVKERLLVKCLCGALNVAPARAVADPTGIATPSTDGIELPGLPVAHGEQAWLVADPPKKGPANRS